MVTVTFLEELLQHGFGAVRLRVAGGNLRLDELTLSYKPQPGETLDVFIERVQGDCRENDRLEIVAENGKITWARIRRS